MHHVPLPFHLLVHLLPSTNPINTDHPTLPFFTRISYPVPRSPLKTSLPSLLFSASFIMFCKATLLTVALALMAAASPITKIGIPIPIEKRSSLTNEDGTFNRDKAIYQTVKTIKYASLHLPLS